MLHAVQNHEEAWIFAEPVNEEIAPGYYDVIDVSLSMLFLLQVFKVLTGLCVMLWAGPDGPFEDREQVGVGRVQVGGAVRGRLPADVGQLRRVQRRRQRCVQLPISRVLVSRTFIPLFLPLQSTRRWPGSWKFTCASACTDCCRASATTTATARTTRVRPSDTPRDAALPLTGSRRAVAERRELA